MPKPSALAAKIKAAKIPSKRAEPVWKGPEVDGVTQSMLGRFLVCRERFRVMVVEGLKRAESFEPPIEYGNLWHAAEEAYSGNKDWRGAVELYRVGLERKYPFDREKVNHWTSMCLTQFPRYVDYWKTHDDVKDRTPILQEQVFDVPYKLPSGRTVRLRGKWDAVDLIKTGSQVGIYLQENKTKSSIDQVKICRQLSFDLQTMLYLVAMGIYQKNLRIKDTLGFPIGTAIRGVRYNVIRRSAHKSPESMLKKMDEDFAENRAGEWFGRWKVEISSADVARFRKEFLDSILEQLCNWYQHILNEKDNGDLFGPSFCIDGDQPPLHWRHPFGVYNVLDEGGSSDLDAYLENGSKVGLRKVDDLFPELK